MPRSSFHFHLRPKSPHKLIRCQRSAEPKSSTHCQLCLSDMPNLSVFLRVASTSSLREATLDSRPSRRLRLGGQLRRRKIDSPVRLYESTCNCRHQHSPHLPQAAASRSLLCGMEESCHSTSRPKSLGLYSDAFS